MSVVKFPPLIEARETARMRAKELVAFLKEKCEPNNAIPDNMKPDQLEEQITQIFFESENKLLGRD